MKKNKLLISIIILVLIALFIVNPQENILATLNGVMVWATALLPALFPFFFFTKILSELGFIEHISKFIAPITKKLYNTPGISGYVYLMGMISGYPVGAKITSDLFENGSIDSGQAHRITAFTSTSGPLFIIGTVGVGMFVNYKLGIIVLLAHLMGAILNGLIYRNYKIEKPKKNLIINNKHLNTSSKINLHKTKIQNTTYENQNIFYENQNNENVSNIQTNEFKPKHNKQSLTTIANSKTLTPNNYNMLEDAMLSSIKSILIIGGYVAIFFLVISILHRHNILTPINHALQTILNIFNLPQGTAKSITGGLIEITKGCLDLSFVKLNFKQSVVICTFIITFGGLSVHMQALTFLRKFKINLKFYFLQKITHTLISTLLAIILVNVF